MKNNLQLKMLIQEAYSEIVGGEFNAILDGYYEEGGEYYEEGKQFPTVTEFIEGIYEWVINDYRFGRNNKNIRFQGTKNIKTEIILKLMADKDVLEIVTDDDRTYMSSILLG